MILILILIFIILLLIYINEHINKKDVPLDIEHIHLIEDIAERNKILEKEFKKNIQDEITKNKITKNLFWKLKRQYPLPTAPFIVMRNCDYKKEKYTKEEFIQSAWFGASSIIQRNINNKPINYNFFSTIFTKEELIKYSWWTIHYFNMYLWNKLNLWKHFSDLEIKKYDSRSK